jgi:gamma-D-glutamyl-L-lysine dipeptidyl-peptidase
MYAVCNVSVAPLRHDPSHRSEMVSQLLFGESFHCFEKQDGFRKIKLDFDGYEGWMDEKQFAFLNEEQYQEIIGSPLMLSSDLAQIALFRNSLITILMGSTLRTINDRTVKLGSDEYVYEGNLRDTSAPRNRHKLIEDAFVYLNAPYLWGGRSPFGIDCSGFTQMVYKLSGISLKRDARLQAEEGHTIHLAAEAEPGDLAFFDNENGDITHTGIILENGQVIHSSGRVKVDKLDHHGIFSDELGKYTHNLRIIKRLL